MRVVGIALWIAGGALAAYAALGFETSVDAGPYFGERIVNQDLQQKQMMMLVAGCVMFAVGSLIHAATHFLPVAGAPGNKPQLDAASTKEASSILRTAYARQLGIIETDEGYKYAGSSFSSIEDAIQAAEPAPSDSKLNRFDHA